MSHRAVRTRLSSTSVEDITKQCRLKKKKKKTLSSLIESRDQYRDYYKERCQTDKTRGIWIVGRFRLLLYPIRYFISGFNRVEIVCRGENCLRHLFILHMLVRE